MSDLLPVGYLALGVVEGQVFQKDHWVVVTDGRHQQCLGIRR